MNSVFHSILRAVASAMELPVVIMLILFLGFAVFSIGWLITEYFTEHCLMKAYIPQLLDDLRSGRESTETCITESSLLKRQKEALLELLRHPDFSASMRESLSVNLLTAEQSRYDRFLKYTDLIAKLSPMAGLLGTLIPLGPGIIALGQGDTVTLSSSLLTAFDTTIAGLVAAGICLVISTIRRRWYNSYMADLETLADCVLELEDNK